MKINEATQELNEIFPPLPAEVTIVWSEKEVREVSELDASVYEGESISHEGLCAWWSAYPKGIYVLRIDSKIAGAVGIWPIKKTTYRRIIKGEIDEVEVKAKDISRKVAGRTYSYWYFADIILRGEYRCKRKKWSVFLLGEAVRQWLSEGNLASELHLCAFGFEPQGISLLEKSNFQPVGDIRSPENKPVYQRTVEIEYIRQWLDGLTDYRNGVTKAFPVSRREEKKYDVFISYRREPAKALAQLIHRELEDRSLNVFLDVADSSQGCFDKAIRNSIVNAPNLILLLSPRCFGRCSDKEDVFRQEIALALRTGSKIIPITMDGFKFPKKSALPADIQAVLRKQCIPYNDHLEVMFSEIMNFIHGVNEGPDTPPLPQQGV